MYTVGAFEAKTHFSSLLEKVSQGERVIITRHGKAIARLIPIHDKEGISKVEVINQLKEFSRKHSLGSLDWKALRDEGRR